MTTPLRKRPTAPEAVTVIGLLSVVLRARRMIAAIMLVSVVATVLVGLLLPRTWTSSASFMPESRRPTGGLSGLAAQLGINLPLTEASQSPAFYADLLESRAVLEELAGTTFESGAGLGRRTGTPTELYRVRGDTPARRLEKTIRRLRRDITVSASAKTGVVTLEVESRDAQLSQAMAAKLLELLNQFNIQTRRTQAAAERAFTAQRVEEVGRDLRAAEDRLQSFLQRNRDFRNSPELTFQERRLDQEVELQRKVYTSLKQALEQARIEEVRDTPLLTVLDRPQVPAAPDSRWLALRSLLAALGGLLLGALLAFARHSARTGDPAVRGEVEEFAALRKEAWAELRHPFRALQQRR
ncbi:MAG: Wzz/FepE/Etk N-terminal domain-containing protein [Gemmatimonadales bacterium]